MNQAKQSYKTMWQEKIDALQHYFQKNNGMVTIIAGVVLVLAAGGYGYRYWMQHKEQAAHTILHDCLSEFEAAQQGKAHWADIAAMCQAGYEKFSGTATAPYILAVAIDCLLADQKQPEALEKITTMLSKISKSPLYNLYALKRALLILDMPDTALHPQALATIEQLANDTKNIYNDSAQFYAGYYYRQQGNTQKAMEFWNTLIANNKAITDEQGRSPWAAIAQEKMSGLPA